MTPQEREARLRAARRMQDEIYQGIGATDRPSVDGESARPGVDRARSAARSIGEGLARRGTQPLRDELARDGGHTSATARMAVADMGEDDEDSQVMGKARKSGPKPAGGY